jgi:hypothetical protein
MGLDDFTPNSTPDANPAASGVEPQIGLIHRSLRRRDYLAAKRFEEPAIRNPGH